MSTRLRAAFFKNDPETDKWKLEELDDISYDVLKSGQPNASTMRVLKKMAEYAAAGYRVELVSAEPPPKSKISREQAAKFVRDGWLAWANTQPQTVGIRAAVGRVSKAQTLEELNSNLFAGIPGSSAMDETMWKAVDALYDTYEVDSAE